MATDLKLKYGSATALTVTGLNSLAAAAYATSNAVDNTTNLYLDYLIELTIANVAEAGNLQAAVYAISSLDGTNYSDNQSGNQPYAFKYVGMLPLNGTGPWRSAAMSVSAAFNGSIPPYFKIVILNDAGVTLAASGNSVQYVGVLHQSV
jgi:hypothetical protein